MNLFRRLWFARSKGYFIVALHLERIIAHEKHTTVCLGLYRADTVDDALGKAVHEHATEGWMLGAWKVAKLFPMLIKA